MTIARIPLIGFSYCLLWDASFKISPYSFIFSLTPSIFVYSFLSPHFFIRFITNLQYCPFPSKIACWKSIRFWRQRMNWACVYHHLAIGAALGNHVCFYNSQGFARIFPIYFLCLAVLFWLYTVYVLLVNLRNILIYS